MELLAGARVALTPRPSQRREAALEAALLGHCPGRVRVSRLLALTGALDDMRAVGFGSVVDDLLRGTPRDLYHLPIPLRSSAEFNDIFPDAAQAGTQYGSMLAGKRAWLAQAVDDFFANGGEKLWVVQVPEEGGQGSFMPAENTVLHDVATLRGLATVLVIPSLGVVGLPDLERLQIPARLQDVPRVRLDNPNPQFMPCGQSLADDHRELRYPEEMPVETAPWPVTDIFQSILRFIARHRPDLQCVLSLPLAYSGVSDSPVADSAAVKAIAEFGNSEQGHTLRYMQFIFPYLRGPRFSLQTAVGLVMGQQAAVARRFGPWRSMAAQRLVSDALPYPPVPLARVLDLREQPGIGVIVNRSGALYLDDERLVVPALPPADYVDAVDRRRYDGFRSAEVMRFLGYLRRQLQALGDTLVFNLDYRDPRPRLLLNQFFRRLHTLGALRGALPEDAFHISESFPQEDAVVFDILVAPAYPIDRLHLTFANENGEWRTEVPGV